MSSQAKDPDEASAWVDSHRELSVYVLTRFMDDGKWPERRHVQRHLDRNAIADEVNRAIETMPRLRGEPRLALDLHFRLPLHIVRYIPDAGDLLSVCFELIREAVDQYMRGDGDDPKLTSDGLDKAHFHTARHYTESDFQWLAERAIMLIQESYPQPFSGGSRGDSGWSYGINEDVARRLIGIEDLDEYFERQRNLLSEEERSRAFVDPGVILGPVASEKVSVVMADEKKLFLSHATPDKPLADLLRDTLVVGGVPERQIFYSADRATGIPAGRDVGAQLKESLLEASLVIELISHDFLQRPMCLMELGGAWVLGVSTYPVVVPPLSREEAVSRIGNVQMGALTTESQVDDVFNELHGRLAETVGIQTTISTWNRAVASFKRQLPSVMATSEATAELTPPSPKSTSSASPLSNEKISFANISIIDGAFGKQLIAEATNNDSAEHSASVKATFYDSSNKIVGARDGVINQLHPGSMKTLTIDSVPDHVTCRLQVDTLI